MALILAIESDRRQVSHLTAMVRGRLRAELVLGDTAEAALERLGDRVPDLVLTSPLLSPKDEQALSDRLRKLNGVASHVQTLTLPVFAVPQSQTPPPRGVLSALLGDRSSDAAPDGCDPAVFAEQCREYLERGAVERDATKAAERDAKKAVQRDTPSEEPVRIEAEFEAPAPQSRSTITEGPRSLPVTDKRSLHLTDNPASIIAALAAAEPETFVEEPMELDPVTEPSSTAPEEEPAEAKTTFVDVDLSELLEEEQPVLHAAVDATVDATDDQPVYDLSPTELDEPPGEPVSHADEVPADFGEKAPADFDEWQQVVDALKRESERGRLPRRKSRGTASLAQPVMSSPRPTASGAPETQGPRRVKRVHDEWGMFDPKEAGMAALFAKLEKLNSDDDDDPPKSA